MEKEKIIISLGGSLVAPGEIDVGFLKNFQHCLEKYFDKYQFFIFVGGGKVCRNYQKALAEFGAAAEDRDWMGIKISRLNAEVVKQVFLENCYDEIIADPVKKLKTDKNIAVGAGFKPGNSTDYVAVLSAKANSIGTIINLTNIDYVFDKDPGKFPDAKPIKEITWEDFRKIVGEKWTPGFSSPFDPEASKLAQELKLKVAVINGKNLDRLEDFLNNKNFTGTIIR
jgi:uridylate kinase